MVCQQHALVALNEQMGKGKIFLWSFEPQAIGVALENECVVETN